MNHSADFPGIRARAGLRLLIAGLLLAVAGCEDEAGLQDRIVAESAVDELSDETYLFPANAESNAPTIYLPVRKWDLLFFGDVQADELAPHPELSNLLIPGRYNHMMVYVGKDAEGFAYASELNLNDIAASGGTLAATGILKLICLGTDRGAALHSSGSWAVSRDHYRIRWARAFIPSIREQLMARDAVMTARLQADLRAGYAYQLQVIIPPTILFSGNRELQLVDDGHEGGAGCAEYWAWLFETQANVCVKDSRMDAADLLAYFRNSPEGRAAYLPAAYNPLGTGDIPVGEMIADGVFTFVNPPPHVYACDGTRETGIVIGERMMQSRLLVDPSAVQ